MQHDETQGGAAVALGVGVRWPWRRHGGWTPAEAAAELQRRLPVLARELARRPGARGVPAGAREEILLEAIGAVSVEGKAIRDERHLLGAFWTAVEFRLRRWHEGRHHTRLGSQQRVPLDPERAPATGPEAHGRLEQLELARTAADHLADLEPLERQVIVLMASQSIGPLIASRQLDLPLADVRSAARSARLKLNRAAVIQQAGRMCHHRQQAITAAARGTATPEQQAQARAHLAACRDCRRLHRQLRRQAMTGKQRRALPALLPAPLLGLSHRLAGWIARRPTLPAGTGERATGLIAGGGLAKAAAATTAIIAATASITGGPHAHHDHHPARPRPSAVTATAFTPPAVPPASPTTASPPPPSTSTPLAAERPATKVPSVGEREFAPAGKTRPAHVADTITTPRSPIKGGEPTAHPTMASPNETDAATREFGPPGS